MCVTILLVSAAVPFLRASVRPHVRPCVKSIPRPTVVGEGGRGGGEDHTRLQRSRAYRRVEIVGGGRTPLSLSLAFVTEFVSVTCVPLHIFASIAHFFFVVVSMRATFPPTRLFAAYGRDILPTYIFVLPYPSMCARRCITRASVGFQNKLLAWMGGAAIYLLAFIRLLVLDLPIYARITHADALSASL